MRRHISAIICVFFYVICLFFRWFFSLRRKVIFRHTRTIVTTFPFFRQPFQIQVWVVVFLTLVSSVGCLFLNRSILSSETILLFLLIQVVLHLRA